MDQHQQNFRVGVKYWVVGLAGVALVMGGAATALMWTPSTRSGFHGFVTFMGITLTFSLGCGLIAGLSRFLEWRRSGRQE